MTYSCEPVKRIVAVTDDRGRLLLVRLTVAYRYWIDGEEVDLMGGPAPRAPARDPLWLRLQYLWQKSRLAFWLVFWTVLPWALLSHSGVGTLLFGSKQV